jgi:hypothetical protein
VEPQRDMSLSVVYTIAVLMFICDSTPVVSESVKPHDTLSVATTEFSPDGILDSSSDVEGSATFSRCPKARSIEKSASLISCN